MINNRGFRWFADLIAGRYSHDSELMCQIELGLAFHGISLCTIYKTDSDLALRLCDAFRSIASEVADGQIIALEGTDQAESVNQSAYRASFKEFIAILDNWENSVLNDKGGFNQS